MPNPNDRISVRDHMVSIAAGGRPFFEVLRKLDVGAIELEIARDLTTPHLRKADGTPYSIADDAARGELQGSLAGEKVRVSALLLGTDFSSATPAVEEMAWTIAAIGAARQFGAPAVRIDPLTRNKELPSYEVRDNFVFAIGKVLRSAKSRQVDLGMENHGPFGNDPNFLDAVFATVDHPRLGMTLDTGNFYWWGVSLNELYVLLKRYAPRTMHTHIKNINYPPELAASRRPIGLDYGKYCCALDEGNIDLRRVIGILGDAGYQRDFCIENETLNKTAAEGRLDVLRRDVEALSRAM